MNIADAARDLYRDDWRVGDAIRASIRLRQAIREGGEIVDPALIADLEAATIGRDFYMDTVVPRDMIAKRFGARVDRLIEGATHRPRRPGELDRELVEDIRLIRLAGVIENVIAIAARAWALGGAWIAESIAPFVDWTHPPYERYPVTAGVLEAELADRAGDLRASIVLGPGGDPALDAERTYRARAMTRGMQAFARRERRDRRTI